MGLALGLPVATARCRRGRAQQAGASLVEVVVAGALLATGLVGTLALYGATVSAEREDRVRIQAELLADDLLERLSAVPTRDLVAYRVPPGLLHRQVAGGDPGRWFVKVTPVEGSPTLHRVRVEVWPSRASPAGAVILETLRTEHGE